MFYPFLCKLMLYPKLAPFYDNGICRDQSQKSKLTSNRGLHPNSKRTNKMSGKTGTNGIRYKPNAIIDFGGRIRFCNTPGDSASIPPTCLSQT